MATPQIHEVDSHITLSWDFLSSTPRSHTYRPVVLYHLALLQLLRSVLSNQREDLDRSIYHLAESILLPPRSWIEHGPMIHEALFLLATVLFKRSEMSERPDDAIYAAEYLRHLRDQPHQASGFTRNDVTTMLVDGLTLQVMLEAGNVRENMGEMADLCRELLTLGIPGVDTTRYITRFAGVVLSQRGPQIPDQPLDQIIECLRAARKHKPDLRDACFALAHSLRHRYIKTFVNDDYEEAASILDEIIASSSPGDSQGKFVPEAQRMVTELVVIRSTALRTPEHSEDAMYRARALLGSLSVNDPLYPLAVHSLEAIAEQRPYYFGSVEDLTALSGNSQISRLAMALKGFEDEDSEIGQMTRGVKLLGELHSRILNDDMTNIDEDIEKGRTMLTMLASSDPSSLALSWLSDTFCQMLFEVFERTNKIEYLNESISTRRQLLERPSLPLLHLATRDSLCVALVTRLTTFPDHGALAQDLDEVVNLFSQCANNGHASIPDRFRAACCWASAARGTQHHSASTAYESAVSLMKDTLSFAPTLQLQHTVINKSYYMIPLDYASYQVRQGQLEEAIETLERGRALLWSEMRHLRTSVDQLPQADQSLGHKFAAVNRDLEELTKSIPPSHKLNTDDGTADDFRGVDPFGRLLLKQRSLLKERDKLISQNQALTGFDSFLTSLSFGALRSAASSGPVIIINHSIWRSDILILLHNASPSLIPTPQDFFLRTSSLKDKLLESRHEDGLDSSHYDQTLASVLAELYELVGKPVIDRLRHLQVPEQSRIWWCPTSVFCSLPLHAMGPIPSDDDEKRYFLDLYICSYTPSLSALIQSRHRDFGSESSNRPSILLVAQPDPSLPTVGGEIKVVQALDTEVTSLISEDATPTAVVDGFHQHRFVHFACHGTLEADKPFEAGFELYGDERLTLLEIVRSHLPTAEFAFLSACHTAEVTEGSAADEGLHLAAAVQYCGFRSVVGTMWAMVDDDGRDLAKHFYKALFSTTSGQEQRTLYHERSAKALRFAVRKLRAKRRITLERWVNFVHYGA